MGLLKEIGKGLVSFGTGIPSLELENAARRGQLDEELLQGRRRETKRQGEIDRLLGDIKPGLSQVGGIDRPLKPGETDAGSSEIHADSPITEHSPGAAFLASKRSSAAMPLPSASEFAAAGRSDQAMAELAIRFPDAFDQVSGSLGLLEDFQKKEAADFAFQAANLPFDQRQQAIQSRVNRLSAGGRDPSGTESLLGLDDAEQVQALRVGQIAAMSNEDRINLANKVPTTRSVVDGNDRVDQQFNPNTGEFDEVGRGTRSPIQRIEQGDPGSFSKTGSQRGKQVVELEESAASTIQAISTASDLLEMVRSNTSIVGKPGSFFRITNDLAQSAVGIANGLGINFKGDFSTLTDPENYDFSGFRETAIQSEIFRSGIVSLSFAAAAASGQSGRDVSDKDVQRFINEIGAASSDPVAFESVIQNFGQRLARNFATRAKTQQLERPDLTQGVMDALDGLADQATREASALPGFDDLSSSEQQELIDLMRRQQ